MRDIRQAWPAIAMGLFIAMLLLNWLGGNFGEIGQDSDDLLRFVQVRDYLRGQSWFDTDQYRMGLTAAGTDMHWSRLPDIPMILLAHFFDIFTTQDKALDFAIFIWPPLSGVILFIALVIGTEQIPYEGDRKPLRVFVYLIAGLFVLGYFRFTAGAIDHHNIQFGSIALAMVFAMDQKKRASRYFLSGLATAVSIAIGPEIYLLAAVICAYIAFSWAMHGALVNKAVQAFGVGLSLGIGVIFVLTIAPSQYKLIYCDALSLIIVTTAVLGGLGLALLAQADIRFGIGKTFGRRIAGLGALGVICVIALSVQAPQCLANPLDSLPEDVLELWLGHVSEAKPIYVVEENWQMFIPLVVGPPLYAFYVLILGFYRRYKTSAHIRELWDADALIFLLLLTASLLTIYQVRFSPFAYIITLLPLARWVALSYQKGCAKDGANIKYIFLLALMVPIIWAIPGSVFVPNQSSPDTASAQENTANKVDNTVCRSDDVMSLLNQQTPGLIVAEANLAGQLLIHTHHSVVSGNYHRNWAGISTEIQIAIAPPQEAYALLTNNKIDYLYFCAIEEGPRLGKHSPQGLFEQIHIGNVPDYLTPLFAPLSGGNRSMLYKIEPNTP